VVLFHSQKNIDAKKGSQAPVIYPIKSATDLLSTKDNHGFLQSIKRLIKSSQQFDSVYLPVIEKFAEFVQNIPENQREFFGQQAEFLTLGLELAARTLDLCRAYFFSEEADFSKISNQNDRRKIYAIFTAALFSSIGKIAVKYNVAVFNEKANHFKKWNPYVGAMLNQGSHYKFDYIKENFDDLRRYVTPTIARQVLDSVTEHSEEMSGFNWIASDLKVLADWFAFLAGEEGRIPMTSFMSVIPRAKIEMVENYRKGTRISLVDSEGDAFLQWLRKEIENERIVINKGSELRVTEKEIFLSDALFQQFISANPHCGHPAIVEKQFIDVLKVYSISISELDQRYRSQGGLSGISDLGQRYRSIGGLSSIQENEKAPPVHRHRYLKGDIGLLALIISGPLHKLLSLDVTAKSTIRPSSNNSGM